MRNIIYALGKLKQAFNRHSEELETLQRRAAKFIIEDSGYWQDRRLVETPRISSGK